MQQATNADTVKHLNSFLRGELSAVETYRQALGKLDGFSQKRTLEDCSRSHQQRAMLLEQEIIRRGGRPAKDSGVWGSFARLVEGGAAMFGNKAAISALEEGEDHGRDDYRRDLTGLDPDAQNFVKARVLPEQLRTHDAISSLKKSLS